MSGQTQAPATLTCQPVRDGEDLAFPFQLTNTGTADIYVFDAVPGLDPATHAPTLDRNAVYVALMPDGFAEVLRGIAPLPLDMSVAVRVIPLATKLPPGESLTRTLTLHQPIHETSPYHPDLPIRQYRTRPIQGVALAVQYLSAAEPGFSAVPYEPAPGLFRVATQATVASAKTVWCRLPARGLSILQRTDAFPRPQ